MTMAAAIRINSILLVIVVTNAEHTSFIIFILFETQC